MQEPRVRGVRDGLRLYRGVHRDALEVLALERTGLVGDGQALLDQRDQVFLAQPLPPARHRRAVERELVPEHLLAAEELVIRVLDPALAQRLVRQVVHVLQDEEPGHQPRRRRWLARPFVTHRAETPVDDAPIDLAASSTSGCFRSMI